MADAGDADTEAMPLFFNHCPAAIYEAASLEEWTMCSQASWRLFGFGALVLGAVCLVILFAQGAAAGPLASIAAGTAVAAAIGFGGAVFVAPRTARYQWDGLQRRVRAYTLKGLSSGDAVLAVQKEDLAREQIAAVRSQARATRDLANTRFTRMFQQDSQRRRGFRGRRF
jgi:hypothetical protein